MTRFFLSTQGQTVAVLDMSDSRFVFVLNPQLDRFGCEYIYRTFLRILLVR